MRAHGLPKDLHDLPPLCVALVGRLDFPCECVANGGWWMSDCSVWKVSVDADGVAYTWCLS